MANPPTTTTTTRPATTSRPKPLRTILIVLAVLLIIISLIILIVWLALRPKHLVFSIESGSIRDYKLSDSNHLNTTFNFVVRAYNPNRKVSVYYDKVEAWVSYDHLNLAYTPVGPFSQPRKNATNLAVNLVAREVALTGDMVRKLKRDRTGGAVELDVRMKARIKFKVGKWKSAHRTLKVKCSPVFVRFPPYKSFERKICDVN